MVSGSLHFKMNLNRNNVYSHETEETQEILDNFRELIHGYNENMRYHHRTLETYHRNINHSIELLRVIFNRIVNNSRSYQNERREPRNSDNYFRDRSSTNPRNVNTNSNLEMDISTLIYLFTTPLQNMNGIRNQENRYLTNSQIERSIEMITYDSETIEVRHCPITLDNFVENEEICRIRGCGHIFRKQPLLQWLEIHVGCPVCRYDLRDFSNNIVDENSIPTNNMFDVNRQGSQIRTNVSSETFPTMNQSPRPIPNTRNDNNNVRNLQNVYSLQLPMEIINNHLEDSFSSNTPYYDNRSNNHQPDENNPNISQMVMNVLRNQLPTFDTSNNLLYTLELPIRSI